MLEASNAAGLLLIFVTITHPETPEVIRLVLDGEDFELDGELYHKSWFEMTLLPDTDQPPSASVKFPNVDRQKTNLIRNVVGAPRVAFDLYSSRFFDLTAKPRVVKPAAVPVAMYSAKSLYLTNVRVTMNDFSATLRSWDYRQEQWPEMRATHDRLPALYLR